MEWMRRYETLVRLSGLRIHPRALFILAFVVLVVFIAAAALTGELFLLLLGLLVADLVVFGPYFRGEAKVREIEENLPDALKQMANTLRSGGTYEVAIREVVYSDYGELSRQFSLVLRDLESGIDFRRAFERLAGRVPSEALRRMIRIMLDAVHVGGGLADVLEDLAEDTREINKIYVQRRTRTAMQTLFIVLLSTFLGPFIFGTASGLMDFMVKMGERLAASSSLGFGVSPEQVAESVQAIQTIQGLILAYTLFQAAAAAFVVSIIREGTPGGGIRNAPIFLVLAYAVLLLGRLAVASLLGA